MKGYSLGHYAPGADCVAQVLNDYSQDPQIAGLVRRILTDLSTLDEQLRCSAWDDALGPVTRVDGSLIPFEEWYP